MDETFDVQISITDPEGVRLTMLLQTGSEPVADALLDEDSGGIVAFGIGVGDLKYLRVLDPEPTIPGLDIE